MNIILTLIAVFLVNNFAYSQSLKKEDYNRQPFSEHICDDFNIKDCHINQESKLLHIIDQKNNPIFNYFFELQSNYEESYYLYNKKCKNYDMKSQEYVQCFQDFRQKLLPIFKSIKALSSNVHKDNMKKSFLKEYQYYLLDLINLNEEYQLNNTKDNQTSKLNTQELLQDPYVDYFIMSLVKQQQKQLINEVYEQVELRNKINNYFNSIIEETKIIKLKTLQLRKLHNPNGL